MRFLSTAIALGFVALSWSVLGQTPQPFPRPGQRPAEPSEPAREPSAPETIQAAQGPLPAVADPDAPTPETLVFPVYPAAQYLASYDAGRGQRYYLFGATAPFADIVGYYRTTLDERGSLVFREPPTHMFEVGRFRDETMAFPPGVTVKDWTWGGSEGYPNPVLRGEPERFPTVIMIVPPPPEPAR